MTNNYDAAQELLVKAASTNSQEMSVKFAVMANGHATLAAIDAQSPHNAATESETCTFAADLQTAVAAAAEGIEAPDFLHLDIDLDDIDVSNPAVRRAMKVMERHLQALNERLKA